MSGRSMSRRSAPRHNPDKFDAISVLEYSCGPFSPGQGLTVQFDQQAARIETATRRKFTKGRGRAYLLRVAVDKNA